jgi:hypothetical protein
VVTRYIICMQDGHHVSSNLDLEDLRHPLNLTPHSLLAVHLEQLHRHCAGVEGSGCLVLTTLSKHARLAPCAM